MFLAVLLAALKGRGVMVRVVLCGFVVSGVLVACVSGVAVDSMVVVAVEPVAVVFSHCVVVVVVLAEECSIRPKTPVRCGP